ncbi:MAG: VanZ family protein [Nitrospira sp.]|nr:VanZ family protein [Nitrospira sp.]
METSSEPLRQDAWPSQLWYWAPVIGYAALIFYFSSQSHPEEQLPQFLMQEVSDKLLHAVEYAVLGVLCYRGFRWAAGPAAARRAVLLSIALVSAYAMTDELHQFFVPSREASSWDWVADTIGAAIGSVSWSYVADR